MLLWYVVVVVIGVVVVAVVVVVVVVVCVYVAFVVLWLLSDGYASAASPSYNALVQVRLLLLVNIAKTNKK